MVLEQSAGGAPSVPLFSVRPTVLIAVGRFGLQAARTLATILDDTHPVVAQAVTALALTYEGPRLLDHPRFAADPPDCQPPDDLNTWIGEQRTALLAEVRAAIHRATGAVAPRVLQATDYSARPGHDLYIVADLEDPLRITLGPLLDLLGDPVADLVEQHGARPRRTLLLGIDLGTANRGVARDALAALRHQRVEAARAEPRRACDWMYLVDRADEDGFPLDVQGQNDSLLPAEAIGGFLALLLGSSLRNDERYRHLASAPPETGADASPQRSPSDSVEAPDPALDEEQPGPGGDRDENRALQAEPAVSRPLARPGQANASPLCTVSYHADVWPSGPLQSFAVRQLAARVILERLLGPQATESGPGDADARRLWEDALRNQPLHGPVLFDLLRRDSIGQPVGFPLPPGWLNDIADDDLGDRIVAWESMADRRLAARERAALVNRRQGIQQEVARWISDTVDDLLQNRLAGVRTARPLLERVRERLELELGQARAERPPGCLHFLMFGPLRRAREEVDAAEVARRRRALDAALLARPDHRALWLRIALTVALICWAGWLLSPFLEQEAHLLGFSQLASLLAGEPRRAMTWIVVAVAATIVFGVLGIILPWVRVNRARRRLIQGVERRLLDAFLRLVREEQVALYQELLARMRPLQERVAAWLGGLEKIGVELRPDAAALARPATLERAAAPLPPVEATVRQAIDGSGIQLEPLAWELLNQRLVASWWSWRPEEVRAQALEIVRRRLLTTFHGQGLTAILEDQARRHDVGECVRKLRERTRPLLRAGTRDLTVRREQFLGLPDRTSARTAGLAATASWHIVETGDPARLTCVAAVYNIPWTALGVADSPTGRSA